jgi:hypothetical protein
MSAWDVHIARITVFPLLGSGSSPKSALELYKTIWGKDPDSYQGPAVGGGPFPASVAQGVEGRLIQNCQTQPTRTDLTFGPHVRALTTSLAGIEDTTVLGPAMAKVFAAVEAAFQGTPINRVAAYMQLGREAGDYREANQLLSATMWANKQVSLADEEDFVLQFNVPRPDTSGSIKLNYITKWSVERVQVLTFQMPVGGTATAPLIANKIVSIVAFDNSNLALQKPFDRGQAERVLSELFAETAAQLKACSIFLKGF